MDVIRPIDSRFAALYYDGRLAARFEAFVEIGLDALLLTVQNFDHSESHRWPYASIRFAADGSYGEPVRIEKTDSSEVLVVESRDFLHALQQHGTSGSPRARNATRVAQALRPGTGPGISAQALLSLLAMDSSGTPSALQYGTQLTNLSYQRGDEEAADAARTDMLLRARIKPDGLITFFARLEGMSPDSGPSFLSSHPATAHRIANLKVRIQSASGSTEPIMTADEWQLARNICASR